MEVVTAFRDGDVWRVKKDGDVLPIEFCSRQEAVDWFVKKRKEGVLQNYYLLIND